MTVLDRAAQLVRQGQVAAAVNLVASAAQDGDAEALFAIANWRLWGQFGPRDLASAHRLLQQAAELGHIDARILRATLIANGTGVPADWAAGLSLLSSIATASAREQLDLLDQMKLTTDGAPADLPPLCAIRRSPEVGILPGFLSPAECTYLMRSAAPRLEPSTIVDRQGRRMPHPVRTSDGMNFGPTHENFVVHAINRRIAAATGTDVAQGEPLHILRYSSGQQYHPHLDTINGESNQRVMTVLVYLNEDFRGGETYFLEADLTVRPRTGDAVVFRNLDADGRPDMKSRHAGRPVEAGVKWLGSRWIRQRPFHPWGLYQ